MQKLVIILLTLSVLTHLCSGCEDCSKPTKEVCVQQDCRTYFFYNAATKTMMPTKSCKCLQYQEVKNECYFKKGEIN